MGYSILLSRVFKSVVKFNLLIVALLLISCGASVDQPKAPSGNSIPAKMLKFLNNGSWRVEMIILDSNNTEIHREEAQVNQETGYVQSGEFFLQPALDYRFIAIFYYKPDLTYELPLGLVVKFVDVGNEAKQVLWEESDIINLNSQISLNILDKIPGQYLPNLDQDGDGYSNYHEAVAGSDGRDPNSIPNPPQLRGEIDVKNQINSLDFELVFDDPLEVVSIKPVGNFTCGYYAWQITDTDPNNPDNTSKKLFAQFNLHAYDLGEQGKITLEVEVKNSLGLSKIYTFENLSFSKDANPDRWGPELYVRNPEANEKVSDTFTLDIQACDENGIDYIQPQSVGDAMDLVEAAEVYTANIQTAFLKDGVNEILIKAGARKDKVSLKYDARPAFENQITHAVIVQNDNPIEIDPSPAEQQSDDIEIGAYVDFNKHPELKDTLKDIYVEKITRDGVEDGNFNALKDDKNSLPERYRGYLLSSYFIPGEATFTVTYRAETKTDVLRRTVTYAVKNNPTIEKLVVANNDYPFNPCFVGGDTYFEWKISNWGPINTSYTGDLITYDGKSGYDDQKQQWKDDIIFDDKVEMDCSGTEENVHTLQAVRVGASQNGAITQPFVEEKQLSVVPIEIATTLPSTQAIPGNTEIKYELKSDLLSDDELQTLKWRATLWRVYDNLQFVIPDNEKIPLKEISGEGKEIFFGTADSINPPLVPRGKYKIQIELLSSNDPIKIVSQSQSYYFYLSEPNLLGWWRFDKTIDGTNAFYSKNFTGGIQYLHYYGLDSFIKWEYDIQNPNSGAVMDDKNDRFLKNAFGSQNLSNGFTVELLIKFNQIDIMNNLPFNLLFAKWGTFALGYNDQKKWQIILAKKIIENNMDVTCQTMQTQGFYNANKNDFTYVALNEGPSVDAGWTHLLYVYDPNGNPNRVYLYVNGKQVIAQPAGPSNVFYFGNCYPQNFGINLDDMGNDVTDTLNGVVGELSFYDKPVTDPAKIKRLCQEASPGVTCQ